jgi:hypothetical protein
LEVEPPFMPDACPSLEARLSLLHIYFSDKLPGANSRLDGLCTPVRRENGGQRRSSFGGFDNSFGKGLRGFLRQIVPDAALDDAVRIFACEFLGVGTGGCTIGVAFKGTLNKTFRELNKYN